MALWATNAFAARITLSLSLRALCDACHEIESAEERNELPEQRWIDQLIDPGTSLGGARPKANVIDADGKLYVAKFPSKKDLENTELIEHFSHRLAAAAGINVAQTRTIKISKDRDLLLSERFDRTIEGRRIHFASAMSLLGLEDGAGSSTGNGYLDIVDFILQGCVDVHQNLRELYRRVAFNVMFGNTDDHFRNHGFLLTPKGWTLSPAYDINPGTKTHQCLLIDQEAVEIIEEVRSVIKDWRKIATELQIPHKIFTPYCNRWDQRL